MTTGTGPGASLSFVDRNLNPEVCTRSKKINKDRIQRQSFTKKFFLHKSEADKSMPVPSEHYLTIPVVTLNDLP
jgi:hypothetical protein